MLGHIGYDLLDLHSDYRLRVQRDLHELRKQPVHVVLERPLFVGRHAGLVSDLHRDRQLRHYRNLHRREQQSVLAVRDGVYLGQRHSGSVRAYLRRGNHVQRQRHMYADANVSVQHRLYRRLVRSVRTGLLRSDVPSVPNGAVHAVHGQRYVR